MHKNFPIILFSTFMDYLDLSVFFGTTIPLFLASKSIFITELDDHKKGIIYGLLFLISPLGKFICTPLWGQITDQYGRRKAILTTLGGCSVASLLVAIAVWQDNFILFLLGRIGMAIFSVNLVIGQASLADMSNLQEKSHRFNTQLFL